MEERIMALKKELADLKRQLEERLITKSISCDSDGSVYDENDKDYSCTRCLV